MSVRCNQGPTNGEEDNKSNLQKIIYSIHGQIILSIFPEQKGGRKILSDFSNHKSQKI